MDGKPIYRCLSAALSIDALEATLNALAEEGYRVKGIVQGYAGTDQSYQSEGVIILEAMTARTKSQRGYTRLALSALPDDGSFSTFSSISTLPRQE